MNDTERCEKCGWVGSSYDAYEVGSFVLCIGCAMSFLRSHLEEVEEWICGEMVIE